MQPEGPVDRAEVLHLGGVHQRFHGQQADQAQEDVRPERDPAVDGQRAQQRQRQRALRHHLADAGRDRDDERCPAPGPRIERQRVEGEQGPGELDPAADLPVGRLVRVDGQDGVERPPGRPAGRVAGRIETDRRGGRHRHPGTPTPLAGRLPVGDLPVPGGGIGADAVVVLVRLEQDRGQRHARQPDHLGGRAEPGGGALAGRHQDDGRAGPRADVVAAEGRVQRRQRHDDVRGPVGAGQPLTRQP